MATFEVYRDARGEYRWRLSEDGRRLACSARGYATNGAARNAVHTVQMDCRSAKVVDLTGE